MTLMISSIGYVFCCLPHNDDRDIVMNENRKMGYLLQKTTFFRLLAFKTTRFSGGLLCFVSCHSPYHSPILGVSRF